MSYKIAQEEFWAGQSGGEYTDRNVGLNGHQDRLFKRDLAGEVLDRFADLRLFDYGFC